MHICVCVYIYIRNSMETTCSKSILNLIKIYGIEIFILKYNNSLSRICLVRTGFSGGSDSKDAKQESRVRSLSQEYPQKRGWPPTPVFLPGKFHGQRSQADYNLWGLKELDMTEQLT